MSSKTDMPSLLVVGGTKAGKTHYAGQLLRRLEAKKYRLEIVGAPSDRTPFTEVLERLAQGRSAPHTPSGFYRDSIWTVQSSDKQSGSQLIWPDYAGEQIETIVTSRQVSEQWITRIRESNGWLLFVRLSLILIPEDVLDRPRHLDGMQSASKEEGSVDAPPLTEPTAAANPPDTDTKRVDALQRVTVTTQAGLVELLQALLFVKQVGSLSRLQQPPLVVVLSCLDEVSRSNADGTWEIPSDTLRSRLPLLSQFIASTWQPGRAEVIGLSALGKALNDEVSDESFMDAGPERQGWCITADGHNSDDLTYPVRLLMEKLRNEK